MSMNYNPIMFSASDIQQHCAVEAQIFDSELVTILGNIFVRGITEQVCQ